MLANRALRLAAPLPLIAALLPLAAGCATVVSGRTAEVALHSNPPNAYATVRDLEGNLVAQTMTPGVVELKRGRTWLRPAKYHATFEKPGYVTTEAPLHSKFNPWAIGNLAIGGGLGLGVDLATGAAWKPKLATLEQSLARVDMTQGGAIATNAAPPVRMASGTADISDRR
ncbi:hypothetical protein Pla108_02510 [Botrimarina colliarenosi]|uniref:PEGA domain-containing protein n=1 Tax=Botrimarina colliarenosi TaxID=2528001 RepID=A0A5C6AIV1_9BACT|nr:hypothetical protein [Botrimarina colliarenosi]TWT99316.1 hypothetical protein Pla108_02510 [Botrimarina colliarenosi]